MSQSTVATAADLSPLPFEPYRDRTDVDLEERINSVKLLMGDSLLILGHHYQQDEVIRFADLRGDSYKLSQLAADSQTCRAIVFCGVHFMAETADVLSREPVEVYLPDLGAGCSMADMADLESVEAAWQDLADIVDTNDITPVTYINSSADLKAFCGRHGGIVCTSSNARAVLDWSFSKPSIRWPSGTRANPWEETPKRRSALAGFCSGKATARSIRFSNPITSSNSGTGFPTARFWFIPNA
jgi:quinolinate synthase